MIIKIRFFNNIEINSQYKQFYFKSQKKYPYFNSKIKLFPAFLLFFNFRYKINGINSTNIITDTKFIGNNSL